MLGSSLLGFCSVLPGKRVKLGDTWTWKGDLLNIGGAGGLVARFKLESVTKRGDDQVAVISGSIDKGWPKGVSPKAKCRLVFSLKTGTPLEGSFDYASKSRTQKLRTKARWVGPKAKAAKTAASAGQ